MLREDRVASLNVLVCLYFIFHFRMFDHLFSLSSSRIDCDFCIYSHISCSISTQLHSIDDTTVKSSHKDHNIKKIEEVFLRKNNIINLFSFLRAFHKQSQIKSVLC